VPGRKTDFADCQWIQLLHSYGLLRGSFRPVEAIGRMRAIRRQMENLVHERTRCVQWMQKALDQMNVQVHRAVTDLTGDTGLAIVRAIIAGERDPQVLAKHRDPRCRKSIEDIAQHLVGNWRDEHLFNLASALRLYDGECQTNCVTGKSRRARVISLRRDPVLEEDRELAEDIVPVADGALPLLLQVGEREVEQLEDRLVRREMSAVVQ